MKERGAVLDFNPLTKKENFRYEIDSVKLGNSSRLLAEADSLFVTFRNIIYICKDGKSSVYSTAPEGFRVTSLFRTGDRTLLAGTSKGICKIEKDTVDLILPTKSRVLAIASLGNSGQIIAGMRNGGIIIADPVASTVIHKYSECDGVLMESVRSFASDRSGNIWAASANGLFKLSEKGDLSEIPINSRHNSPVHSLMSDSQGNIWMSTHYDGLLYNNITSENHTNVIPLPGGNSIMGIVEDKDGILWAATDGHGLWRYTGGFWTLLPGTNRIKYQRAFCFPGDDNIFTSDWSGNLYSFDRSGRLLSTAPLTIKSSDGAENVVWSMEKTDTGQYLVGTNNGVCLYSPEAEDSISRNIRDTKGRTLKIISQDEHTTYIMGRSLDVLKDGELKTLIEPGTGRIYDIASDETGTVWGYTENGIVRVTPDGYTEFLNPTKFSVPSGKTPNLISLDGKHILGSTSDGLFLIDCGTKVFSRYGINDCSKCLKLSDGSVLAVTKSEIVHIIPSEIFPVINFSPAVIDRVTSDNLDLSFSRNAVLDHTHTSLSFEAATFNYSGVETGIYEYRMDGLSSEWQMFDLSERIEYRNLLPGRYTFRVRSSTTPGEWISEDSIHIRIRPIWFASKAAIALWALIAILAVAIIVRAQFNRKVLAEKLRLQQEENERQASFFVNLSYKMRTPINLVIGQLEQYFRENGARIKNVESLQDIYSKTKEIRSLIADYVDVESEAFEREPQEVKFLNALTGVVERHLFEKEINVSLLCEELSMGKTRLSEVTKKTTGMSPGEFIEDVRLRHAAQMLLDGNYRVSEIADTLGFSSVNYFGVRFKKKFGCPPSKYRGT